MKKAHKLMTRAMKSSAFKKSVIAVAAAGAVSSTAMAGTDTTFDGINTTLTGWLVGSLGILIALIGLGVGLAQMSQQKWSGMAIGFAVALLAATGPGIIDTIFTLTV